MEIRLRLRSNWGFRQFIEDHDPIQPTLVIELYSQDKHEYSLNTIWVSSVDGEGCDQLINVGDGTGYHY